MIRNLQETILHKGWKSLKSVCFDILRKSGNWQTQTRQVYDTGDAAAILLYDRVKRTVVLTRQFRINTYMNGNSSGMLLEVCAGKLDGDSPEDCITREAQEETGYAIQHVRKLFEAYIGPGAITEIIHFFIGQYDETMKTTAGGGLEEEGEEIEVIEMLFDEAWQMLMRGEIMDAKTIALLQYAKLNEVTLFH
ncbi:MAG TPA: NUDIX domain-containing protein [Chitinophagaceae bacterium]|nr:NUDIX domain-containing protein [Chitinophagaceae bacterium]